MDEIAISEPASPREPVTGDPRGRASRQALLLVLGVLYGNGEYDALLADLGAEVIVVHRKGATPTPGKPEPNLLDRGKRSIALDLKAPGDLATAQGLIRSAQGLTEGLRPGVMERLGLGPEAAQALNPALVYGRMTGWGQDGPLAKTVGHDINYLALSGALSTFGEADRPARPPLNLVGDYAGGALMGAIGLLSGILQARTTGTGAVVDIAMTDGVALMTALFHALKARGLWTDQRDANLLDGSTPFYRCYRCRDGGEVAVGALEPRFYAALLAGLGLLAARRLWPAEDPQVLTHRHDDLPLDHPHLDGRRTHAHTYIIDDYHRSWERG